jgi:hypothetical protein
MSEYGEPTSEGDPEISLESAHTANWETATMKVI